MPKFTLGKWEVYDLGNFGRVNVRVLNNRAIAFTGVNDRPVEENEANARLIAASPELYELVRRMYERDQRGDRVTFKDFADMETLLAKVDGEQ